MKKRVEQLKSLSIQEWRVLLASLVLLPITALFLQLSGVRRTRKLMSFFLFSCKTQQDLGEAEVRDVRVVARMVSVAARYGIYRANCLKQSLVLWWLLARCGIVSEIRIGVQKEQGGGLNAHAWVEYGGQPLSQPKDIHEKFSAFETS